MKKLVLCHTFEAKFPFLDLRTLYLASVRANEDKCRYLSIKHVLIRSLSRGNEFNPQKKRNSTQKIQKPF